jgi:hypothetical protein
VEWNYHYICKNNFLLSKVIGFCIPANAAYLKEGCLRKKRTDRKKVIAMTSVKLPNGFRKTVRCLYKDIETTWRKYRNDLEKSSNQRRKNESIFL